MTRSDIESSRAVPFAALAPFMAMTFLIAWGILGLYIFAGETMTRVFGALTGVHPLFYLAVYAPAISAFLVIGYTSGGAGLRRYLSRLFYWRCGTGWWTMLLVGIPLVFFAGAALKGTSSDFGLEDYSAVSVLTLFFLTALKGPVEEFGWRGLALPLLQSRFAPLWSSLILGVIWGIWHLPAFLLSGTQQAGWDFLPFFAGTVALSVIVTALFNASRGSILLPAIFHFQLINPLWPDAQPYDTYLLILAAAAIAWVSRNTLFSRAGAVTTVVPEDVADDRRT